MAITQARLLRKLKINCIRLAQYQILRVDEDHMRNLSYGTQSRVAAVVNHWKLVLIKPTQEIKIKKMNEMKYEVTKMERTKF